MDANRSQSPSPKKLKVDLNDSFYNSEDDELLNQACSAVAPLLDASKQTPEPKPLMTPTTSAAKGRPLMHSTPVEFSLRGKPLDRSFASVATPEPFNELIMSTSKPFYRLAQERKEQEEAINALTEENAAIKEERDDLRGKVIYLEQRAKTKDNEIHEIVMQLAEWRKKHKELEHQLSETQSKYAAEVLQLQTQIRFLEEGNRAEIFSTSSEYKKAQRDENGKIIVTTPEKEDELQMLSPLRTIQALKPRMTSASASKLNFSGNL